MTTKLQAPANVASGTIDVFRDATTGTVDAGGRLTCPAAFVGDMLNAGFTPINAANPAWQAGRFYGPPQEVLAAVLTVASVLYAVPLFVPSRVALKTLNVSFTTGQTGGVGRVGLYADNGGIPDGGALIIDAGEMDGTGTAVRSPAAVVTLEPGLYWVATTFNATSTMPSVIGATVTAASRISELLGSDSAAISLATATTNVTTGRKKTSFTYAALPATFPTGSVVVTAATCPVASLGT